MPVTKTITLTINFRAKLTLEELRNLVAQASNIEGSTEVYLQPARGVGDNATDGMVRVSGKEVPTTGYRD